jgi:2-iminobutanoate/2-iminopropanoate deaminase
MSQLTKTIINPANSPPAVGPYNHAVRVGDLLFCSGQIPVDPADPSASITGDIQAQTTQALNNVQAILNHQGLSFAHVVKSTVFMTDLHEFSAMNEVYARYFPNEHPARSTVQVAALPRAARVEIEIIAHF